MKKLLMISVDSMMETDLAIMRKLPNFGFLLSDSSIVLRNESTYPTATHSVHTSLATGCYPGKHGVIANDHFQPGNAKPDWYEHYEDVRVPMLPVLARKHGYTSASVMYPLTLGAPFDYVLHRKMYHHPYDRMLEVMRDRSSPGLFEELYPHFAHCLTLDTLLLEDMICFESIAHLIRHQRPDIIYTHIIAIDTIRHHRGVFGPHIEATYDRLDQGLGIVLEALRETALLDKTIVVVTADHGHLDIDKVVSINRFFLDHGLMKFSGNGSLSAWDAYCHTCSMSGHIYIRGNDPHTAARVRQLLGSHANELDIGQLYTRDEINRKHRLDGPFAFVIESPGKTAYSSDPRADLIAKAGGNDSRYAVSAHGYEPQKGFQPSFFMRNPYAVSRVTLPKGRVIDQAPTLAHLLGFTMPDADGQVIPALTQG